jgi:hypothetical protein
MACADCHWQRELEFRGGSLLRDLSLGGCKLNVAAHLSASSSEPAICSLSFEMILARSISMKKVLPDVFLNQ